MSLRSIGRSIIGRAIEARPLYQAIGTNTVSRDVYGVKCISFGGQNLIHHRSRFSGTVVLGKATTIGLDSRLAGPIQVGKYCQFAGSVAIFAKNHPTSHLSTYVNSRLLDARLAAHSPTSAVDVGNDVWIGFGAIVLPGVRVGNGAVIGAGAVVTNDVAPYAIVVGVPAVQVGQRFPDEIVTLIEKLAWWDRPEDEVRANADAFDLDLATDPAAADRLNLWLDDNDN